MVTSPSYIEGHCYSKSPNFHTHEWTQLFCGVPHKGDIVKNYEGYEMEVSKVIHTTYLSPDGLHHHTRKPIMMIELIDI